MEHLTPKETAQFLHDNPKALFIDCRSEMEFLFVGHPVGASGNRIVLHLVNAMRRLGM